MNGRGRGGANRDGHGDRGGMGMRWPLSSPSSPSLSPLPSSPTDLIDRSRSSIDGKVSGSGGTQTKNKPHYTSPTKKKHEKEKGSPASPSVSGSVESSGGVSGSNSGSGGGSGGNHHTKMNDKSSPSPSPVVTAKNARNFWQLKASKAWKPPSSRGEGSGSGSGVGVPRTNAVSVECGNGVTSGEEVASSAIESPSRSSIVSSKSGTGSFTGHGIGNGAGNGNINSKASFLKRNTWNKKSTPIVLEPELVERTRITEHECEPPLGEEPDMDVRTPQPQDYAKVQRRDTMEVEEGFGRGSGGGTPQASPLDRQNVNSNANSNTQPKSRSSKVVNKQNGTTMNKVSNIQIGGTNNNGNIFHANRKWGKGQQHSSTTSSSSTSSHPWQRKLSSPQTQSQPQQQSLSQEFPQTTRSPLTMQRQPPPSLSQQGRQVTNNSSIASASISASPSASISQSQSQDGAVGEMQIKLDIAAAKLLTEEMKYKDLSEQLEATQSQHEQESDAMRRELHELRKEQDMKDYELNELRKAQDAKDSESRVEIEDESKRRHVEIQELYLEIERLHESQRAERSIHVMVGNERDEVEKQKNAALEKLDVLTHDLQSMRQRATAAEENAVVAQASEAANKHIEVEQSMTNAMTAMTDTLQAKDKELRLNKNELQAVKKDIEGITNDFKDLAEETERLEIELEAVTEDRDELLRRSVLYHNQAQAASASSTPNSTDRKGTKKSSSLNESSRKDYEEQQQEAEITRLRTALHEQETLCRTKDEKIQDLEKRSKAFELDLSVIEVENMSYFTNENSTVKDSTANKETRERFEKLQGEYSTLNNELSEAQCLLQKTEEERDNLKLCLADAMQELEDYEANGTSRSTSTASPNKNRNGASDQIDDVFTQELIQIIKEKDQEIQTLTAEIAKNANLADKSSDSLRDELDNVLECLNSSTRINGSPSIEIMLRGPTAERITLSPEDEEIVQAIHKSIKSKHFNFLVTNTKLKNARGQLQRESEQYEREHAYDTMSEASFERRSSNDDSKIDMRGLETMASREADEAVKRLRYHVKASRDENDMREKANGELRKSLKDAADLIKPLKEHVTRIENERVKLQLQLDSVTYSLAQLERESGARNSEELKYNLRQQPENFFGKMVEISAFDLRKKDEEIVELKIEINQLHEELHEIEEFGVEGNKNDKGRFDEMPTPTKSNRSQMKGSAWESAQASGEEKDRKSRMVESEIIRLNRDLKKKSSAEETLKLILRDSSNRLTLMSTQAETLANEKNEAENRIRDLEKDNVELETRLHALDRNPGSSPRNMHNINGTQELNEKLEEAILQADRASIETAELKAELKMNSKERKKLKKHLEEAVGMLNSLRNHVETSEKERKKLKRHLRTTLYGQEELTQRSDGTSSMPPSSQLMNDIAHVPDPDQMENTGKILNLRSYIVKLEHEIRNLEERIGDVEAGKSPSHIRALDSADDQVTEMNQIRKLKDMLAEAESAHQATRDLLNEVSGINTEMLSDLKQTESEAAASFEELDILKRNFAMARDEIEKSKYIATTALQKLDSNHNRGTENVFGTFENVPLTECISRLEMQVHKVMKRNLVTPTSAGPDRW
uniref:Uncharacterized protein n=1 Tax=Chaetoceros debilis TaxID=122233 RepID=A0A7S3Q4Q4_9STRA